MEEGGRWPAEAESAVYRQANEQLFGARGHELLTMAPDWSHSELVRRRRLSVDQRLALLEAQCAVMLDCQVRLGESVLAIVRHLGGEQWT